MSIVISQRGTGHAELDPELTATASPKISCVAYNVSLKMWSQGARFPIYPTAPPGSLTWTTYPSIIRKQFIPSNKQKKRSRLVWMGCVYRGRIEARNHFDTPRCIVAITNIAMAIMNMVWKCKETKERVLSESLRG